MKDLIIDCSGYLSCQYATIQLQFILIENLNMKFGQRQSIYWFLLLNTFNNYIDNFNIDCIDSYSCSQLVLSMNNSDIKNFNLNCTASDSCNNINFKLSVSHSVSILM